MDRRQFLKWAGLVTGGTLPLLGGAWWMMNRGEDLPSLDPYAPEPWQVTGADGPVLLLINEDADHPFGRFLAEILWAEGLNGFSAARLPDANAGLLGQYACVLLSAGKVSEAQTVLLAQYASGGGNLVVFQPEDGLAESLGLGAGLGEAADCRARTNPRHPLARGIVTGPLSLHVPCRWFAGEDAETVVWMEPAGEAEAEPRPVVVVRPCGAGMVAAWGYDLAHNLVLTRQGNPANAGIVDEYRIFRPIELFEGWIDFDQMAYPQADEQQRLLANLLTWMCRERTPLPRLWYFPGGQRCLLLATSDSHRNTGAALDRITGIVEKYQGRLTINYTPPLPSELGVLKNQVLNLGVDAGLVREAYFPTPQHISRLRAAGHEITLHTYIGDDYIGSWREYWRAFSRMGYGPVSSTTRTHDLTWLGWAEAARLQAGYGIRMNTDYYHFGNLLRREPGVWGYGHFTGSGLPMRFADVDGRILNIYQQVTQLSDDHFFELPWTSSENMGVERGVEITREMIQASLDGNYAAIAFNFHSDPFDMAEQWQNPARALLEGSLAAARENGVFIWTVEHWLEFTQARQQARFENLGWQDNALAFDLTAGETSVADLSVLLPLDQAGKALQLVRVDGQDAAYEIWQVGGVGYGRVSLAAGSHRIEARYL